MPFDADPQLSNQLHPTTPALIPTHNHNPQNHSRPTYVSCRPLPPCPQGWREFRSSAIETGPGLMFWILEQ